MLTNNNGKNQIGKVLTMSTFFKVFITQGFNLIDKQSPTLELKTLRVNSPGQGSVRKVFFFSDPLGHIGV